jgi:hypothetical protein
MLPDILVAWNNTHIYTHTHTHTHKIHSGVPTALLQYLYSETCADRLCGTL